MKVIICHSCGLTMCSGVTTCRRCNQKNLSAHDIYCNDTYRLHKRINELAPPQRNLPSSVISAITVFSIASLAILAVDYIEHPNSDFAKQARQMVAMVKPQNSL